MKQEAEERDEQEKQYEMYLEEIADLRQQIKKMTPSQY